MSSCRIAVQCKYDDVWEQARLARSAVHTTSHLKRCENAARTRRACSPATFMGLWTGVCFDDS